MGQERGMSYPKKGKSLPKKGKLFPIKRGGGGGSDFSIDDHAFAMKIAAALKSELKNRSSRAKLVAGLQGENERAGENWIDGECAPPRPPPVALGGHFAEGLSLPMAQAGWEGLWLGFANAEL